MLLKTEIIGLFILILLGGCIRNEILPENGSSTGWIVGNPYNEYGTIYYTVNEGFYWQREGFPTNIPDVPLNDVSSANVREAWVCGPPVEGYGLVLYTDDGGCNWVRKGNKSQLRNITFLKIYAKKTQYVWTIGTNGWVSFSSDKGGTWTKSVPDSLGSYIFQNMTCSDSGSIWVVGYDSTQIQPQNMLLFSNDNGSTWTIQHPEIPVNTSITRLFSINDTTVWLSAGNTLYGSVDCGITWNKKTEIADGIITGISASNEKEVWLITNTGHILHTENGGGTWRISNPFGLENALTSITMSGTNRIWITGTSTKLGSEGIILYSRNGGTTWFLQDYPGVCGLNSISFAFGNR
ncbi:MAG: hypothetical protein D4R67_10830 [Bacteroidetes bacterium]|nr:MAG: hypothetical protein D4R67_10830 [Bacteroidota bacterium]